MNLQIRGCECNVLITILFILVMHKYLSIVIGHTEKSMHLSELKLFKKICIFEPNLSHSISPGKIICQTFSSFMQITFISQS